MEQMLLNNHITIIAGTILALYLLQYYYEYRVVKSNLYQDETLIENYIKLLKLRNKYSNIKK